MFWFAVLLLQDPVSPAPQEAQKPWELAIAAFDKDFETALPAVRKSLVQELAKYDRPDTADRLVQGAVIVDKGISALLPEADPPEIPTTNPTALRWLIVWRGFAAEEKSIQEKILALEEVRAAIVLALRSFKEEDSVEWMAAAVRASEHEAAREAIVHAMSGIADDRINPALLQVFKRDKSPRVLVACVETSADRRVREVRDALRAHLGSEDWRVRLAVLLAIPKFADVQLNGLFRRSVIDPRKELRLATLAGIESTGDRSLTPVVFPLLKDGEVKVRLAALDLLGKFGNRAVIPWVTPLFDDPDASVRAAAIVAIEKSSGRKGVRALAAAIRHPNEDVSLGAIAALVRINHRIAVDHLLDACKGSDAALKKGHLFPALASITGETKKNEREYATWWDLEFRKAAADFDAQFLKSPPAKKAAMLLALAPHDRKETAERLLSAMLMLDTQLQRLVPEKDKLLKEQTTIPVTAGVRVWQAYYAKQKQIQSQLMELESIWNIAVEAISDLSNPETMGWMAKRLPKSSYVWEREGLAQAMGGADPAVVSDALMDRAQRDKEWTVRVYAIDSLAALRETKAAEALTAALSDDVWHVRLAALLALERIFGSHAVEPLIGALGKSEGRIKGELQEALVRLTGVSSCVEPAEWEKWWGSNKEAFLSGKARNVVAETEVPADPKLPTFWGFTVTSKRVIFVVDISGSMLEECEQLPPTSSPSNDAPESKQKIHVAKYELRQVVRMLSEDTLFNIVAFSFGVQPWQSTLVPATKANKEAALVWIKSLPAVGGTNTFDSLEAAFQIKGPPNDKKRDQGADTIFFVSDGRPSAGRIVDPNQILQELGRLNQPRRVKINTVAVGKEETQNAQGGGVDPGFLKRLAEQNFGSSVWRK